jgi:5-methylcytosine-specific restriction protein A
MPRAPKKCGRTGCTERVTGQTYCAQHQPIGWKSGGRARTDTAESKAWRRAVLDRCHWRCEILGPRCQGRATQADHIRNVAAGGNEHDLANGQGACKPCHDEKTQREAAAGRAQTRSTPRQQR